jgi:cyclic pyranopterin phosphate synthase
MGEHDRVAVGPGLVDTYGRAATDLWVSLTDRCDLRCASCMPEEGLRWPAKPDLLTDDEVVRLIRVAVAELGIDMGRVTERRRVPRIRDGATSARPDAPVAEDPLEIRLNGEQRIDLRTAVGRPRQPEGGPAR